MINRYTQPAQQSQGLSPFQLPYELLYKSLVNKQTQYDAYSDAVSTIQGKFAGMQARLESDANYLYQKNQDMKAFVDDLANKDLTKIPNLKQKILNFAIDPNLTRIEYNNKQYDDQIKLQQEQLKDNTYNPANWTEFSLARDNYNNRNTNIPDIFTAPVSPNNYDIDKELMDKGKLIKPSIQSYFKTSPDGTVYVSEESNLSPEQVYSKLSQYLSPQAIQQYARNYKYETGKEPSNDLNSFNEYVGKDVFNASSLFEVNDQKINNVHYLTPEKEEKNYNAKGATLESGDGFSLIGPVKAAIYTVNKFGLDPEKDVQTQLTEKIKTLNENINNNVKNLNSNFTKKIRTDADGYAVQVKTDKGLEFQFDYYDKNGVIANDVANQLQVTIDNDKNAVELISDYTKDIEDKTLLATQEQFKYNDEALTELNNFLTGNIKSIEQTSGYKYFYNKYYNRHPIGDTKGLNKETIDMLERGRVENAKKYAKEKYASSSNKGVVGQYLEKKEQAMKDAFIYESTFGNAMALDPTDKDYQSLSQTFNSNPDQWFVYDNSTGLGVEKLKTNVMKDDFDYVNLSSVYYNPVLKKVMAMAQLKKLKPKNEWVPNSDESNALNWEQNNDEEANKYYSVDIETLDTNIMNTLFGENATSVDRMAKFISSSVENSKTGYSRLPLDLYSETNKGKYRSDMIIKKLDNGNYSVQYLDPDSNKWATPVVGDLNTISNALIKFGTDNNLLINQSNSSRKDNVTQLINTTFNNYSTGFKNELLTTIGFETAGTYDHKQENLAGSGAKGYIQFMPSTLKSMGISEDQFDSASPERQMMYVKDYLKNKTDKINNWQTNYGWGGVYLAIYYPAMLDYSPNTKIIDVYKTTKTDKQIEEILRLNSGFTKDMTIADLINKVK